MTGKLWAHRGSVVCWAGDRVRELTTAGETRAECDSNPRSTSGNHTTNRTDRKIEKIFNWVVVSGITVFKILA